MQTLNPSEISELIKTRIEKVKLAAEARVSADAYPQSHFAATVAYINPGIDIARASATVKLTVSDPPAYLRQNMTVSVDIATARRTDVLSLPGVAVRDALTGAPWVLVIENGRAVRRPVRLGLQGDQRIVILGGVAEGAQVIQATSEVVAGDRVKAAAP